MTPIIKELENQIWLQELTLLNNNVKIFVVGGFVRDMLLGTTSSDIDLLVCGLTHSQIESCISQFGKVVETNGHFNTIKFRPFNWDKNMDDIDIVIPRTDITMTDEEFNATKLLDKGLNRHNAFKIISDPTMGPKEDLQRRDISINSVCQNIFTGEILDPFNGIQDLENGIIKMTNKRTFIDDPVRMIRVLRFTNRYNFAIEENTLKSIKNNAHLIKNMSKERFLMELIKLYKKHTNLETFINLMIKTELQKEMFGTIEQHTYSTITTFSEFIFLLMGKQLSSKKSFLTLLKGDMETAQELEFIQTSLNINTISSEFEIRKSVFNLFKIIPKIFISNLFSGKLNAVITQFLNNEFVTSVNDLAVNGDQIKTLLGINDTNIKQRGMEIGKLQKLLVDKVLNEELNNSETELLTFISSL